MCLARRLSWLRCLSPLSADRSPGANQIGFRQRDTEREGEELVSEGVDILAQWRGEMPTRCRGEAEEGQWTNVNVAYS